MSLPIIVVFVFANMAAVVRAAGTGVDTIANISPSEFTCLYTAGFRSFFGRVCDGINTDPIGIDNIKEAETAGFLGKRDAYWQPCIVNPPGKSCPRAYFGRSSAYWQARVAIDQINSRGAHIGQAWLQVFKPTTPGVGPNTVWSTNTATNRNFITAFRDAIVTMGAPGIPFPFGIQTRLEDWNDITGSWTGMSGHQLWWAEEGGQDFATFAPFGGWTTPTLRRYDFGVAPNSCGSFAYNADWFA
jgi:hypothetical protein